MADISEAIKRLTYLFTSDGADKVASDMKNVNEASAKLTAGSVGVSEANLSLDKSFGNLERRYVSTVRQQQDYAKVQQTVGEAVKQNPALQERGNVILAEAALKYGQAGVAARAFAAATSGVSGQLIALSAGAGPVGVFLSALGPWGLAAAVGIGVTSEALHFMNEEAKRMSELSRSLRDSAQTIGINTDQMQALNMIAAASGVQTDKNTVAFERFTVQLNELRKGTGTLYTQLLAVNRPLVEQLAGTRDVTTAIDLLAKSYANATDQIQKNAIARAAFGRAGFDEGRVLTAINAAGGLDAYKAGLNATDVLTQNQIQHWALLGIEIEHATTVAKNNIASIFTSQILESEKRFADIFLNISRAAKELNDTDVGNKFFANIGYSLAAAIPGLQLIITMMTLAQKYVPKATPTSQASSISSELGNPYDSGGALSGGKSAGNISAAFEASQYKALVSALGGAASAYEHLREKQLALNAELAAGTITKQTYDRALAGVGVEYATTAINSRIGALGMMASATDIATREQLKINKSNLDGANISRDQRAILVETAQLQAAATKINTDANFGLASATEILNQRTAEFINTAKQRNYTDEQTAAGLAVVARNAKQAYEASQVAASAFPGLTRAIFDSRDSLKQFDQLATQELDALATGFASAMTSTDKFSVSLSKMGINAINIFNQMIMKMLVMQTLGPLLGGTGGLFGGLFGGGGGLLTPEGSAKGNVFDQGHMIHPYALGGIFSDIVTRPTMFPMANGAGLMGEAGPEAIMPLKRGPDGRLGVAGSNGGTSVVNNFTIENHGADVQQQSQKNSSGGTDMLVMVRQAMAADMGEGHFDVPMKARFGIAMRGRQR